MTVAASSAAAAKAAAKARLRSGAPGRDLLPAWPVPVAQEIPLEPGPGATFGQRIPLVHGSDEIVVTAAQFDLEATRHLLVAAPVERALADATPGLGVTFSSEVRLARIVLSAGTVAFSNPATADPNAATADPAVPRLLIRSATRSGQACVPGPPLYAIPPFPAGLFGILLGGATIDGQTITLPPLAGTAFVLQIARGSTALDLSVTGKPGVDAFRVDANPRDVAIAVAGETPRTIWGHGGPQSGTRETISFVPAAQKALSTALAAATKETADLELALQATTASSGTLAISAARLDAAYIARPSDQPRRIALRGSRELVPLDVPAGATPSSGTLSLSARFLGRQLNSAYEAMPDELPAAGLRVHSARSAAVLAPFAPLAGSPSGSSLALASVRLPLIAFGDAEVAVELHADTGGAPGALLAPHDVRQLEERFRGWCEIVLPEPLALTAGSSGIWVVVRATKGDVLWCGRDGTETASLTSTDGGASWSEPAALLGAPLAPLVQLFHATVTPPAIAVTMQADQVQQTWTLARAGDGIDFEASGVFPGSLHKLFGTTSGKGRAVVDVRFSSPAAIDLTLDAITFSYPVQAKVF
jgi:hypothetical protein